MTLNKLIPIFAILLLTGCNERKPGDYYLQSMANDHRACREMGGEVTWQTQTSFPWKWDGKPYVVCVLPKR